MHENSKLKPGQNMLCTEIDSEIQNNFVHNMIPQFLQKEVLLTKIYLYSERMLILHKYQSVELCIS